MSSHSEQHTGDPAAADPALAVVAEESADGTYEIRVTRGGTGAHAAPAEAVRTEEMSRSVSARSTGGGSPAVPRVALVGAAAALAVVAVALGVVFRPAAEFEPPPIPPPVEPTDFEVFRIHVTPAPSVSRSVLSFDAGGGAGEAEGSGQEGAAGAVDEGLNLREAVQGATNTVEAIDPIVEVVPLVDGVPELDEVTRNQLREIRVETPQLVGTPDFELPAVEDDPSNEPE